MKSLIGTLAILLAVLVSPGTAEDHPDRRVQEGVPQGTLKQGEFTESKIFPGTKRSYSVYVPSQYRPEQPASLMVFMDGSGYASRESAFRVPTVFDNLIHQKAMPVTIAVFVNPGTIAATKPGAQARSTRSFEYDSLGDRYTRFLIDEFLPVALDGLNVSPNPVDRAVCGISSSGICAFTVAWERPDQFGKVLSHIGSFTNIRGGWAYPGLVRKSHKNPKPIKVYLQDGKDDLNNLHGNWPLGNQDLAAALQFAGYRYKLEMTDGGHSGKWGGEALPEALRWLWAPDAESTKIPITETHPAWEPHPDAVARDDVPHGRIEEMPAWESRVFHGTTRNWSIYVPAQYREDQAAALMVFQDGSRMRDVKGRWRVPVVFDNLIARGDMPPTIAVFLDPGHEVTKPRNGNQASNRSLEYDSLGDRYARFLLEEILPQVEKKYRISPDPALRAIGGSSSGAICAFTVAWEHPEAFRKVYSSVGSFTHLRGGNIYPSLVRKTEPKPIRVYMADTSGDVDNAFGSWPWANQLMASALKYMGYDVRFDWAEGYAHNADFGGARFPDAMKWLWRDEPHKPVYDTRGDLGGDLTLLKLLIPGESWEVAVDQLGFADGLCADGEGNLYFSDLKGGVISRIAAVDGTRTDVIKEGASGLKFSPDGKTLYACQGGRNRIIAIDLATGAVKTVAENVKPNDLVVTREGEILITVTGERQVVRIQPETGEATIVDTGLALPNGIALSNDGGTLAVSEYGGEFAWMFRVNPGAVLDARMPVMPLRRPMDVKGEYKFNEEPPYQATARGDGMAVDRLGRYYVTSAVGIQVFDPTGRPCGVIASPNPQQPLASCALAGPRHTTLYAAGGTAIYRRKLTVDP